MSEADGTFREPTGREVLSVLGSRWLLIAASTIICGTAAVAVSFLVRPTYRAEAVLAASSSSEAGGRALASVLGNAGELASLAGIDLQSRDSRKQESLATLQSRLLIGQFIRDENLLPVLYASKWDGRTGRWKVSRPEDVPTQWDAEQLFRRKIFQASEDRRTGLITVAVEWKDPIEAADWANALVKRANSLLKNKTMERSRKHLSFLQAQLGKTSDVGIQQAIYNLMSTEIKNLMLTSGEEEFAFRVVDPAVPPGRRSWPNRPLFALLGLCLGFVAGILVSLNVGPARASDVPVRQSPGESVAGPA